MKYIICCQLVVPTLIVLVSYFYLNLPNYEGTLKLSGVWSGAQILRTKQGIPRVEAEGVEDTYYALGFAQAQDRLWQMEMLRRAANGRLSEIFGEETLQLDLFAKNIGVSRESQKTFKHLSAKTQINLKRFAEGVNAAARSSRLPIEYTLTWTHWEDWAPEDSIAIIRQVALMLNPYWGQELLRHQLNRLIGNATDIILPYDLKNSPKPTYTISDYEVPMELRAQKETQGKKPPVNSEQVLTEAFETFNEVHSSFSAEMSNGWVVSGKFTESGKPIVSGDPHLPSQLPSIFYPVSMKNSEWEVSGIGIPGVPVVVLGSTSHMTWTVTAMNSDTIDTYIHKFDQEGKYLFGGKWETPSFVEESIKVKGESQPRKFNITITKVGPVLENAPKGAMTTTPLLLEIPTKQKVSLRWVGNEVKDTSFDALMEVYKTKSTKEFKKALEPVKIPNMNVIYATESGDIGYQTVGTHFKKNIYSVAPLEAWNSSYYWTEFVPFEEMPYLVNPRKGYIVSANNLPAAPNYKHFLSLGGEFADSRAERISQLLENYSAKKKLTVDDMIDIQLDEYNLYAEKLLRVWIPLVNQTGRFQKELRELSNWNYYMKKDSYSAGVFQIWFWSTSKALIEDRLNDEGLLRTLLRSIWYRAFVVKTFSESLDYEWCDDFRTPSKETCSELLSKTLEEAIALAGKRTWGDMHHMHHMHIPLTKTVLGKVFDRWEPVGGSDVCVHSRHNKWDGKDFSALYGVGARFIVDLGNQFASKWSVSTGVNGHLFSRFYYNLGPDFNSKNLQKIHSEDQEFRLSLSKLDSN